jgi:hypothetical protein
MIQLEDKLYTSTEVADILGVSLRSVYRYLEEEKLDAEVKTATGRHRFSKKNILDFLYPNGSTQKSQPEPEMERPAPKVRQEKAPAPAPVIKKRVEEPVVTEVEEEEEQPAQEEPIDWLAKFREAARKYKEEAESAQPAHPAESSMSMADTVRSSRITESPFAQNVAAPKAPEAPKKHYYRSNLGGLKDIAQNIDRGSRNSFLDYAFTLNAGLSLYKPIKPFSMLHAYVKPGDLSFFEKLLGLTPTDEANAQLCLVLSEENEVYKQKEELHGLFVVSRERLIADVQTMGDSALAAEAAGILK